MGVVMALTVFRKAPASSSHKLCCCCYFRSAAIVRTLPDLLVGSVRTAESELLWEGPQSHTM